MKTFISYKKRVSCRACLPTIERPDNTRLVEKTELDSKTMRMLNTSSYVIVDRHEEMKNYKVSDFALENLIAINANLSENAQMSGSPFTQIDNIERELSKVSNSKD